MKKKQIIIQMINTYLFTKFKFNEKKLMGEIVIENPFARDKLYIKIQQKQNGIHLGKNDKIDTHTASNNKKN